jgi:hypothetical protein
MGDPRLVVLFSDSLLVVLFGDSLLMDGVEASLCAMPELGVMRMNTAVVDVRKYLTSLRPDLVIIDWEASQAQLIVSVLKDQPRVTLLGLDVTSRKVVVVSSHQFTPLTVDDLAQMIQKQISHRMGHIDPDSVVPDEWRTEILH